MDVRIPMADEALARILGGMDSEPFNALIARRAAFIGSVPRRVSAIRISLPGRDRLHPVKIFKLRIKKGSGMLMILLSKAGIGARKGE